MQFNQVQGTALKTLTLTINVERNMIDLCDLQTLIQDDRGLHSKVCKHVLLSKLPITRELKEHRSHNSLRGI